MPNTRELKVCATCGKAEGQHWADHWKKRHPGNQPRKLLPGEAPIQPFNSNWINLIKDKTTRNMFLKGVNQVPLSQNTNQQANLINNLLIPQPMQDNPQITNQNDQQDSLEQIQVQEEDKEQVENDLDFSSTPTQELFKIAERTLQEIKQRLVTKQKALNERLTYALDTSQSIEERYVSRVYQPQVGCHPSISKALPIDQVNNPFSIKDVISFEGCTRTSMAPESCQLIARIIKEQDRVKIHTRELECAIKCLRVISLPTDLTLNNYQADVQLAGDQLSKRQRMLLRQPIKQVAATNQPDPQPSKSIKLTPEEERAITYPYLHGSALERIEEQPVGPKHFVVDDLVDIGDDIKEGVNSVDGARHLLTLARKKVGDLKYSRHLKERLLTLIKYQRDHISRGLQHFLNMVLLPYPTINMVKTKVTLVFNSPFMKDRTFTVSDISKDRRDFTKSSTVSLRSLTAATNSISETTSAILDFTEALEKLEIAEEDSLIIMPLMKEVINAVRGATGDIMMKGIHRMMRLQKVLTRVASRLQESNLLSDLMEEDSKKKYWIKSNLRDHVKMVMRYQRENAA